MHGNGLFVYSNGDFYTGDWKNNQRDGNGTYTYDASKTQYVGNWNGGEMTQGKWILPDGSYYQGKWQGNQPNGSGSFFFPNGNCQQGEYRLEDQNGEKKLLWRGSAFSLENGINCLNVSVVHQSFYPNSNSKKMKIAFTKINGILMSIRTAESNTTILSLTLSWSISAGFRSPHPIGFKNRCSLRIARAFINKTPACRRVYTPITYTTLQST